MKKYLSLLIMTLFLSMNYGFAEMATGTQEHLQLPKKLAKKATTDLVLKTDEGAKIMEYNLMEVTFAQDFSTKTAKVGDSVDFLLNDGLRTKEGTELLPKGTKLNAEITSITLPKSFNRSGKVTLKFNYFETPEGVQIPLQAKLFEKDFLSRGKLNALGKGLGTTLLGAGIGIGAGCGIGAAAGAVIIGGFAIGLPVGVAVGGAIGLATPGLHYKAKAGDKIAIQLTDYVMVQ